jgi:hypothetical protein
MIWTFYEILGGKKTGLEKEKSGLNVVWKREKVNE